MSINKIREDFKKLSRGETLIINSENPKLTRTVSSDGLNVFVNGLLFSTLERRKQIVDIISKKGQLAIELTKIIGENSEDMFDAYEVVYDSLDDMTLFVKNEVAELTLIYMTDNNFIIEKIKKTNWQMNFYHFWIESNELKYILRVGNLSANSIRIIKEEKTPLNQNFHYDMLFDNIDNYSEMLNIKDGCKAINLTNKKNIFGIDVAL